MTEGDDHGVDDADLHLMSLFNESKDKKAKTITLLQHVTKASIINHCFGFLYVSR